MAVPVCIPTSNEVEREKLQFLMAAYFILLQYKEVCTRKHLRLMFTNKKLDTNMTVDKEYIIILQYVCMLIQASKSHFHRV